MPMNRDIAAGQDLRARGRKPPVVPPLVAPPPPGQPGAGLTKTTAGTPMTAGPTQRQLARRARNNGTPMPAPPMQTKPGVGGAPAPTPAGAGSGRGGATRGPNTAADPLPPEFSRAVKAGKFSEAQARKNWARSLGQLRGPAAGAPATPTPGTPAPPTSAPGAGPAAGSPVGGPLPAPGGQGPGGGYGGGYGGQGPGHGGGYGPFAGPGSPLVQPGTSGGMTDFRDPMMTFLSAVPMMNINRDRQINDAMSQFGDTGNRWSSTAMGKAGEIGAESAMAQNTMLADLLRGYSEGQENRALQAGQLGLQASGQLDQQAQDRVRLPFEMGQYEQQRQDEFSKMKYADFENNKLGYFPYLLGAAQSQGAGSPGQVIQTAGEPAKPGLSDWMSILAQFF